MENLNKDNIPNNQDNENSGCFNNVKLILELIILIVSIYGICVSLKALF